MNVRLVRTKEKKGKGKEKRKTKPVANQHLLYEHKHFVLFLCDLTP